MRALNTKEKQIGQGAEAGRPDPSASGCIWKVAGGACEGEGEGAAGERKGRRREAAQGGSGTAQARTDAEGAVWGRPKDGVVRILQGGPLR